MAEIGRILLDEKSDEGGEEISVTAKGIVILVVTVLSFINAFVV